MLYTILFIFCGIYGFLIGDSGERWDRFVVDEQQLEAFSERISLLLQKYDIPGATVAFIEEGALADIQTFGFADRKKQLPMMKNSIFQLASISKTFASWGILKLVEKEKIDLEKSVETYLTKWTLPKIASGDVIKIKMLLNHLSGLSPESYIGYLSSDPLPTLLDSLNGIKNIHTKVVSLYPPGQIFFYSGGNYSLLQLIVEEVTGMSFSHYMQEEIFTPLQLSETSFDYSKVKKDKVCVPYGIFKQALPLHLFTEEAAAGLYSTISDVAAFIIAMLDIYHSRSQIGILKPSTLISMIEDNEFHYGLGYETETLDQNIPLAYHFGANPGWRTGLFVLPEQDAGFVVLTNSDNGRQLVVDLAADWIKLKTKMLPGFYQDEYMPRYCMKIILYSLSVMMIFLTFRNILALWNGEMRKYFGSIEIGCWLIFLIGWIFILCSSHVHPLGWVIGAFMPAGFLDVTNAVFFFCGINVLICLTRIVHSRNCQKTN